MELMGGFVECLIHKASLNGAEEFSDGFAADGFGIVRPVLQFFIIAAEIFAAGKLQNAQVIAPDCTQAAGP